MILEEILLGLILVFITCGLLFGVAFVTFGVGRLDHSARGTSITFRLLILPGTEKISTYRVRLKNRRILLNPEPLPPGTDVEPARFEEQRRHQPFGKNHRVLGNIYNDEAV